MLNALAVLAADGVDDGGVSVSVGGLLIGLLVGVLIYVIGVWLARETGASIIRVAAAVIAVIVFLLLGFDFSS